MFPANLNFSWIPLLVGLLDGEKRREISLHEGESRKKEKLLAAAMLVAGFRVLQ